MEEFPGIVFRDGPTGRRTALDGGPDVWELIATLKSGTVHCKEAIHATAELLNITVAQLKVASRYYGAFSSEVDRRICLNVEDADEVEAAWRHEQVSRAGKVFADKDAVYTTTCSSRGSA